MEDADADTRARWTGTQPRLLRHHGISREHVDVLVVTASAPPVDTAEQLELKQRLIETDVARWQLVGGEATGDRCLSGAEQPETEESLEERPLKRVAGVDISFLKGSSEHACASIVVLEFPSLRVLYEAFTYVSLPAPYIAGFLAFREVPALAKLYRDLEQRCPEAIPDVTLVDGNGVLHPHGFGLASHFGVLMGIPTVGVGKTFLHIDGLTKPEVKARMADAHAHDRAFVELVGHSGKVWGAALCGATGVSNPTFVSVGHMVSLASSVAIVRACCQFRVPEPIRQADIRSRQIIRQWEQRGAVDTTLDSFHALASST